jgi:hypothetical protein
MALLERIPHWRLLKTELATDPAGLGYAGKTAREKVDLFLARTQPGPDLDSVSGAQLYNAIDSAEYAVLLPAAQATVNRIIGLGDTIFTAAGTRARSDLLALFGAGTATRTSLLALLKPNVARATLVGLGPIDADDVTRAEALP